MRIVWVKTCLKGMFKKTQHTTTNKIKSNHWATHAWAAREPTAEWDPCSRLCPCATHHYCLLHSPASAPRACDTHLYSVSPSIAITCVLKAVITTLCYTATLPPPRPCALFLSPSSVRLVAVCQGSAIARLLSLAVCALAPSISSRARAHVFAETPLCYPHIFVVVA